MAQDTDIQLLAQRVEAQEKLNASQALQIEKLQEDNNRLQGALAQQKETQNSGIARFAIQSVSGLVVAIIGGVIWSGMDANTRDNRMQEASLAQIETRLEHVEEHADDEGHPDRMIARLDVQDQKLAELQSSLSGRASASSLRSLQEAFQKHTQEYAHPQARDELTRVVSRLNTIDREQTRRQNRIATIEQSTIELEALAQTLAQGIAEHEEEIDALEVSVNDNERAIASNVASTGAAFVEVETQIRSWVDVANLRAATMHIFMQQLSQQLNPDQPLPDLEFFPQRIPAQATTQVGKINGD